VACSKCEIRLQIKPHGEYGSPAWHDEALDMFSYELCTTAPGSNLTLATTIPMIYLGIVLKKRGPLSSLGNLAYFATILVVFTVWGVFAVRLMCQPTLGFGNVLVLALISAVPPALLPMVGEFAFAVRCMWLRRGKE